MRMSGRSRFTGGTQSRPPGSEPQLCRELHVAPGTQGNVLIGILEISIGLVEQLFNVEPKPHDPRDPPALKSYRS